MSVKDWVAQGRIHTASLTTAGILIGWVLGGGQLFSPTTLLLFIFALGFHYVGFSQNNLTDYNDDMRDPAKRHFPLVSGAIRYRDAVIVYVVLQVVVFIYGLWLTQLKLLPVMALLCAALSGSVYNAICKRTLIAPIYISLSFMSIPAYSYFIATQVITKAFVLLMLYAFFLMLFQISVEGYIKDLDSDRVNLMRTLGAKLVDGRFICSNAIATYSLTLKAIPIFVGLMLWREVNSSTWSLIGFMIISIMTYFTTFELIKTGKFDRRVRWCAATEILVYFALVFALEGVLGWIGMVFFILYPIIYFIAMNRYLWGSLLTPNV